MQKRLLLRLCSLFWNKSDCVRELIGSCEEHYLIKKNIVFLNYRPLAIHASLSPHFSDQCNITHTAFGEQCCVPDYISWTVFLNREIIVGIYRWTVYIDQYDIQNDSHLGIGIAPANTRIMDLCSYEKLGGVKGTCSFCFGRGGSFLHGVKGEFRNPPLPFLLRGVPMQGTQINLFPKEETTIPERSFVSAEVVTCEGTLSFFVGEKKVPRAISCISVPLFFGMSAYRTCLSLTSVSFRRLPCPTPTSTPCTYYERD